MWLDSKAVNCPQKWGNFKQDKGSRVEPSPVVSDLPDG